MPLKHDFSEIFEREDFYGKTVGKGEFHNIITRLCKLQSHIFLDFLLYFYLFYTDGNATDQTDINVSPNP